MTDVIAPPSALRERGHKFPAASLPPAAIITSVIVRM